jgi:hypothetical protein
VLARRRRGSSVASGGGTPDFTTASKPVAKSGADAARVERISLDLRDHPRRILARTTVSVNESDDDRDAPDLEPLDDLCV